jgi:hypothetical protein
MTMGSTKRRAATQRADKARADRAKTAQANQGPLAGQLARHQALRRQLAHGHPTSPPRVTGAPVQQLDYQAPTVPITAATLRLQAAHPAAPQNTDARGGQPSVTVEMVDASRAASTFATEVSASPQGAAGLGGPEYSGDYRVAPISVGHEPFTTPQRPATFAQPPGWMASTPLPGEGPRR